MTRPLFAKPADGTLIDWAQPLARGLAAAWLFNDGSLSDVTRRGGDGSNNGSTLVRGKFGGSARLFTAASSQYINIGSPQSLDLGVEITVAVWYKPTTVSLTSTIVGDSNAGSTIQQTCCQAINQTFRLVWANQVSIQTGNVLTPGVWTQGVFVRTRFNVTTGGGSIYVNGTLATLVGALGVPTVQQVWAIGRLGASNSQYLDGAIDHIMVWNRALSPVEIKSIYSNPFQMFTPPIPARSYFFPLPAVVGPALALGTGIFKRLFQPAFAAFDTVVGGAPPAWSPLSLPGLKIWHKPRELALNNNDPISTDTDYSGNGFDATQVGASRPTLKKAIVNAQAIARYISTQTMNLGGGALSITNNIPSILFVDVFTTQTLGISQLITFTRNTAGSTRATLMVSNSPGRCVLTLAGRRLDTDGNVSVFGNTPLAANTFYIAMGYIDYANATVRGWVNGGAADVVSNSFQTAGNTSPTDSAAAGYGIVNAYGGDQGDRLVFVPKLSVADMNTLGAYLATTYGLTWTPIQLPVTLPGLKLWFSPRQIALNDNDPISTLVDYSGNGWNATAVTTARPTFKIVNGLAIARYDGSANVMSVAAGALGITNTVASATIVTVASTTTVSAGARYMIFISNNGAGVRISLQANGTAGKLRVGGRRLDADAVANLDGSASLSTNTFNIFAAQVTWSSATVKGYVNGGTADISTTSFQTSGNTDTTNSAAIKLGAAGASFWSGDMGDQLVFVPALSLADLNTLGAYLASLYGLTWNTAV